MSYTTESTLEIDRLLKWFMKSDFNDPEIENAPEKRSLFGQFLDLYAGDISLNQDDREKMVAKYQKDWESVFLKKVILSPPIPEDLLVSIFLAARTDKSVEQKLKNYCSKFVGTQYYINTITKLSLKIESEGLNVNDWTKFKFDQPSKPTDDSIDANVLLSLYREKKPKNLDKFSDLLADQINNAPESSQTYISCQKLFLASIFFSFGFMEKELFKSFFEDSENKRIMAQWRKNPKTKAGKPKPLAFPHGTPSDLGQDEMKGFVGYYGTQRFNNNVVMVNILISFLVEEEMFSFMFLEGSKYDAPK